MTNSQDLMRVRMFQLHCLIELRNFKITVRLFIQQSRKKLNAHTYLLVIEVVYESGEAPGLVLQPQRQHGDVSNKYGVKDPRHLQVVAGPQRLDQCPVDMNTQRTKFHDSHLPSAAACFSRRAISFHFPFLELFYFILMRLKAPALHVQDESLELQVHMKNKPLSIGPQTSKVMDYTAF